MARHAAVVETKIIVKHPSAEELRDKIWFFTKLFGRKPEITASLVHRMPFGMKTPVDKVFGHNIYAHDTKIDITEIKSVVLS